MADHPPRPGRITDRPGDPAEADTTSRAFPADATAPSAARRHVRAVLAGLGLEHLTDVAVLAVSELVTNALLHAGSDVRVRVVPSAGGRIRIEVTDRSTRPPEVRHYASTASVGRGLGMLSALGSWGVASLPGEGKVVWFETAPDGEAGSGEARSGGTPHGQPPHGAGADDGPDDGPDVGDGPLVTVQLLGFPLQLFAAARVHHEELIREFTLLALAPTPPGTDRPLPHRLVELIDTLGDRYRASVGRPDVAREAAVARGDRSVGLTYRVPASVRESLIELDRLLTEADAFCDGEHLLTLAPDPISRHFRRWFTQEFVPADRRPAAAALERPAGSVGTRLSRAGPRRPTWVRYRPCGEPTPTEVPQDWKAGGSYRGWNRITSCRLPGTFSRTLVPHPCGCTSPANSAPRAASSFMVASRSSHIRDRSTAWSVDPRCPSCSQELGCRASSLGPVLKINHPPPVSVAGNPTTSRKNARAAAGSSAKMSVCTPVIIPPS
jgi:anti-sigma regulatory factor (Ser/Thr protein kinase)